jgi:hypothetical protein
VQRIVSVAVQRNWVKMMMKFLLNGVKELNGQILKNAQVRIETSKLLRAIKPKMTLAKASTSS